MEVKPYGPLTGRAVYELATPNTWGASVIPVLLGVALAAWRDGAFRPLCALLTLLAAIAMHCAVNAFNHGFDGLKGDDTLENCLDPHDAPVVYHHLNPRQVIALGAGYLTLALVLALYLLARTGPGLLVIGLIGAAVAFFYAGGPKPITHLPLGEVAAGFTMGGLITLASHTAMTGAVHPAILLWALPIMVTVAMVLLLNNVCDIEKDIPAGRKTLPICIGRPAATALLRGGYTAALAAIAVLGVLWFRPGLWILIPTLLLALPRLKTLYTMAFTAQTRMAGMKAVLPLTPILGGGYVAMILLTLLAGRVFPG